MPVQPSSIGNSIICCKAIRKGQEKVFCRTLLQSFRTRAVSWLLEFRSVRLFLNLARIGTDLTPCTLDLYLILCTRCVWQRVGCWEENTSFCKLWLGTHKAAALGLRPRYFCALFCVSALWNMWNSRTYVPFSCKTKLGQPSFIFFMEKNSRFIAILSF